MILNAGPNHLASAWLSCGKVDKLGGFFLAAVRHHPACPLRDVVWEGFISFKSFSGAVEIRV